MKIKFLGVIVCVLLMAVLPITSEIQTSKQSQTQLSDSYEDYQELQMLPDPELDSNYETHENDNNDAFEAYSLFSEVVLLWSHQDGDELNFRSPSDVTNNLPDCEEYVYVSESFTWNYNVLPTMVSAHLEYSINLDGDFDTVTYPQLFRVYAWIIDSSGEWTRIFSTFTGTPTSSTSVTITASYQMNSRAWGGVIESSNGIQTDPNDTLTFAVGLGPTYAFYHDESQYWNWMNGAVQVIVDSMTLTCVVNPTPDEEDTLLPDIVIARGTTADDVTNDIAVSEEGNIYTLGTTIDEIGSMTVNKWNSYGIVLWSRSLHGENSWNGMGITLSDTEVIAVGSAAIVDETDTLIAKWNHQGQLIWNKTFDLGGNDFGLHVDVANDGSIFVLGRYYRETTFTAYLAKFSSDGELIWSQECGYAYGDYPRDIAIAYDGYIYTATFLTIAKWDSEGTQEWNRTGVYSSVKVTRDGNLYTTNLLPPRNLLQQWDSNGTEGWSIALEYNHTYAGEVLLYPVLLDVTPAGWAYVKLTSAQGIGRFVLAIFDTEGLLLWNRTMDPRYMGHPYYFYNQAVSCVHSSGFVCFTPSLLNTRGDLDFGLQIYLSGREPPIITSPLTIVLVAVALVLIAAIPVDYIRRRRSLAEKKELPEWVTTQVYLRS